jgi:NAD(P)-dependent dehydrogenase (short-subunit alcohol dehydrogenase family)
MAPIEWDLLKDRSVLITGGASGLGEATTRKFHSHGAYVTIADVQDDLGKKLTDELGERTSFVHCDTTDWDSSAAAFKHAANFAPSKTIDVVVLFAGVDGERRGMSNHFSLNESSNEPCWECLASFGNAAMRYGNIWRSRRADDVWFSLLVLCPFSLPELFN